MEILEDSLLVSHHPLPLQLMPSVLIVIVGVLSISLCRKLLGFLSHSEKYKTIKCLLALGKVTITALCLQMNFQWVLASVISCKKTNYEVLRPGHWKPEMFLVIHDGIYSVAREGVKGWCEGTQICHSIEELAVLSGRLIFILVQSLKWAPAYKIGNLYYKQYCKYTILI